MKKYIVEVNNEILGNSKHIMELEQVRKFNLCAYALCKKVLATGGTHSTGMWTVREALPSDRISAIPSKKAQ